jgi:hypothetical protein
VQHAVKALAVHVFHDEGHFVGLCADAHEQQDARMPQLTELREEGVSQFSL